MARTRSAARAQVFSGGHRSAFRVMQAFARPRREGENDKAPRNRGASESEPRRSTPYSNSWGAMPAWRRMLRSVPVPSSWWRGTFAVLGPSSVCFRNLTWLPLLPTSTKPAASSRRFTSRYGRGLSGMDLDVDLAELRCSSCSRLLEMEFKRLTQIRKRLALAFALAGDISLETLCNEPVALTPDAGRELLLDSPPPVLNDSAGMIGRGMGMKG